MRARIGWIAAAVAIAGGPTTGRAEVIDLELTSVSAPPAWQQTQGPTAKIAFTDGVLVTDGSIGWRRELPLSASKGWTVAVTLAVDTTAGGYAHLVASDGQQTITLQWMNGAAWDAEVGDPHQLGAGQHTIRVEVHGGRKRLLIDGKLVDDRETQLTSLADRAAEVRLFAVDAAATQPVASQPAPAPPPHVAWKLLAIDTAPRKLARARKKVPAAIRLADGPFAATWLVVARAKPALTAALAKLALPKEAGLCVAAELLQARLTTLDRSIRDAESGLDASAERRPICTPAKAGDCKGSRAGEKENEHELERQRDQARAHLAALRALADAKADNAKSDKAIALAVHDPIAQARWGTWLPDRLRRLETKPRACR